MDSFVNRNPRVSVVMPAFNAAIYLAEAIESILKQTYRDFEFIIINDGSTDLTSEIIKSYQDLGPIRLIEFETNRGLANALNEGINNACGEYIVRMDADDVAVKDRLQLQVEFMDSHPSIGASGTLAQTMNSGLLNQVMSPNLLKAHLLLDNPLVHPTMILRTSILQRNHFLYDGFVEDYRLWVKLSKVTLMAVLPEVLLYYRLSGDQFSVRCKPAQSEDANLVRVSLFDELLGRTLSENERLIVSKEVLKKDLSYKSAVLFLNEIKRKNKTYSGPELDYVLNKLVKRNLYFCKLRLSDLRYVFGCSYLSVKEQIYIAKMVLVQTFGKRAVE